MPVHRHDAECRACVKQNFERHIRRKLNPKHMLRENKMPRGRNREELC